ncbi:Lipid transfer protein VAS [Spatholobus suberectus]|nr:Lipid transfer protein VAS [Spatholobus suberectus]
MYRPSMSMRFMMGWVFVMGITVIADGQTVPLCANQLSPCIDFMNSTNPPDTCCNPIKEINATQKTCFCQLALTPGILEGLGTTTTQAVQLLHLCGVNFEISTCKASSSAPPPSLVQLPAMLGGDEGGAGRVTFTGLSFALILCACVLLN